MRQRQPSGKPKITCSKCGSELEESRKGKQRYCKKCHAAHMRATRPKHSFLTPEQRKRANARSFVNEYMRRGLLKKESCISCGNPESEKHHPNYDKPLAIIWLCRKCHLDYHNNEQPNKIREWTLKSLENMHKIIAGFKKNKNKKAHT